MNNNIKRKKIKPTLTLIGRDAFKSAKGAVVG